MADVVDSAQAVASDVETLRERISEIEQLVRDVEDDTGNTVENVEETNQQVNRGLEGIDSATDDQATSTHEIASMLDDAINISGEGLGGGRGRRRHDPGAGRGVPGDQSGHRSPERAVVVPRS
jgi:methyl-accepting chemotaxis protein